MYSAFDEAATKYETAAADLVSKYDSAVQANFKKIDPGNNLDISLAGKKVLLDALTEAFKEGGDEGLTELSNKFSEMSKEELKTYVDDLVKELKAKEDDTILLSDAEKELLKTYGYSEEAFVDYVKQLREANKELANNKEQAKEVAMANVRMNKGLETLSKGFKD
jgi:polyhydroxyalkanoate synthesis regulator phasin